MTKIKYIQSWLLIIILALSVHGVSDAKLAPASISFSSVTHHGIDHIEQQKYHYDATVNIQYCCGEYADKALQEIFQDKFAVAFTRYGNATKGLKVQFGSSANQVSHAFRHTDKVGLSRGSVQSAISRDLSQNGHLLRAGSNTRSINVGGIDLTFNAHRLSNGTVNFGRITPPR